MNTSKSLIAIALQVAAVAGLLTKDGKASPSSNGAGDGARIGDRVAKVRQLLNQAATEQMTGVREVNGVRVNWADWHKGGNWGNGHWRKGGWGNGGWHNHWGNGGRGNWGNGGWGNGGGFRVPFGWANLGWPNGGVLVAPGWHKYWWNR